jgi:GNAT superfamily N-acetyltransferase
LKPQNKIVDNYRNNDELRNKYHRFISEVFPGLSFKDWYAKGFWTNKYIPFSIIKSGKIISNVSASIMDIILDDKSYTAVQLGAVGTLPGYRNQGLSRELIDHVISKYKNSVDFFFLFANDTVMDFYPKFGFKGFMENVYIAESNLPQPNYSARKLNLHVESDYSLILDLINQRQIITKKFAADNYGFITMWHIINLYPDNLYYLEEEKAILIVREDKGILYVLDAIFSAQFNFHNALAKIMREDSIKCICYYFPPDVIKYHYDKIEPDVTGLFILGDITLPQAPFRFPLTAIT